MIRLFNVYYPVRTLILLAGEALIVWTSFLLGTVVQLRAPAELRARILSLYMVALGVVYPLGAVVQGFLADRLGLRAVTVGAALVFLAVVLAVRAARPALAGAFSDPVADRDAGGLVAPPPQSTAAPGPAA